MSSQPPFEVAQPVKSLNTDSWPEIDTSMKEPFSRPKTYLSDDAGKPSSMRLMSLLALIFAGILAFNQALGWRGDGGDSELILYFLVAAFGPKAVQKFAEIQRD